MTKKKTCSRYRKDKEKEIKAYYYKKYPQIRQENSKKGRRKQRYYKKKSEKMVIGITYLLIIILNVNALSSQIKKHRVAEWILKKIRSTNICQL